MTVTKKCYKFHDVVTPQKCNNVIMSPSVTTVARLRLAIMVLRPSPPHKHIHIASTHFLYLFVMEVVKKRTFYGQADRKR